MGRKNPERKRAKRQRQKSAKKRKLCSESSAAEHQLDETSQGIKKFEFSISSCLIILSIL